MLEGNAIAEYLGITDRITCLPFVRDSQPDGSGDAQRKFWVVEPTGDEEADTRSAGQMADMLVLYMAKTRFTPLLGWVIRDMVKAGRFGLTEICFLQRISEYACRDICMKPEHLPRTLRD